MGIYHGKRENPCPRCGGIVHTIFVSVGNMGFYQRCGSCKAIDFTEEEDKLLGKNESEIINDIK